MTVPEDALDELAALAAVALTQADLNGTLSEICAIAVRAIPGATGASLTMMNESGPAAVAFSDEGSRALDEMQNHEHEGPCLDASRTGQVFRVRDLTNEHRWPSYAPLAAETGARSVLSIPVTVETKILGALNVYAPEPDAFGAQIVALAEVITAHASLATQVATALFAHQNLSERLQAAMTTMPVVEQAKGILMAQRRITAEAAFDVLRERSQHSNVKLRDIARQIVETGELPTRP
jgi:transcriptional regulator with GAF, ATPase, and Fis domain